MIRVQSLKSTIVLHLAAILLPLAALAAYHSLEDAKRTASMERQFRLHGLALEAKERYAAFGNGAADTVDTRELGPTAFAALQDARRGMQELARQSVSVEHLETAGELEALEQVLVRDRSLRALLPLRGRIVAARNAVVLAHADYEARLNRAIRRAIADSQREQRWTAGVLLLALAITAWFVFRMIRYLSRPLGLAVSVADRIAEGRPVADAEFDLPFDVGNLVRSLGRMHKSLDRYRNEVAEVHGGLEQKIAELAESQASLAEAQRLAKLGNWHWALSEPLAHWSDEMYRVLGMSPGSCAPTVGNFLTLVDPAERDAVLQLVKGLAAQASTRPFECRIRTPAGEERVLSGEASSYAVDGRVVRMHGTLQDVTERRRAEAEIQRLAHFDSLTGLPNRKFFRDHLERTVGRAQRKGGRIAAMFLDLDRFKRINDTLGHAAGDVLLNEVARRLNLCVRAGDTLTRDDVLKPGDDDSATGQIARLGGDEFTIALDAIGSPPDAAKVARRILAEMARPFEIEGQELVVTASIGISVFPDDAADADTLLKNADAAMYRAKEQGRNNYQFFAKEMNTETYEKLTLEGELRRALSRNQFLLHYQPKFDVRSGRIVGVEALLRWQHPRWGLLPPEHFVPIAEDVGLIVPIGAWVLETACAQLRAWHKDGIRNLNMAINLASPSFREPDLVTRVAAALEHSAIAPQRLIIEVTESILMHDTGAIVTLGRLRDLGVKISIDDFGTGYSSLSYLRKFPIDQLKIDRSFVKEMTENAHDAAICSAIVSLGHSLKLEVVAEGVETARQARVLMEQGCRLMQGYFFSRPMAAADLAPLLRRGPTFSRETLESLRRRAVPVH